MQRFQCLIACCLLTFSYALGKPASQNKALLDKISDVSRYIQDYYVEPISSDVLTENAIRGMLSSLDRHSIYLNHKDAEILTTITNGSFPGIGATVTVEGNNLAITSIVPQGPADNAGVKVGDLISHIDGEPVNTSDLYKNIVRLRGKEGSLLYLRITQPKPRTVIVKRSKIDIEEVSYSRLPSNIGLIEIQVFSNDTEKAIIRAVKKVKADGVQAILFDLRDNPGGLLNSAINSAALLLDKEKHPFSDITHIIERDSVRHIPIPPSAQDISDEIPIFILINNNTASGAEIFASALQYHGRGIVLGGTSTGKGSVQSLIPLEDNSMIKLTTAYFTTPNGSAINDVGVTPDYELDTHDSMLMSRVQETIFDILTQ